MKIQKNLLLSTAICLFSFNAYAGNSTKINYLGNNQFQIPGGTPFPGLSRITASNKIDIDKVIFGDDDLKKYIDDVVNNNTVGDDFKKALTNLAKKEKLSFKTSDIDRVADKLKAELGNVNLNNTQELKKFFDAKNISDITDLVNNLTSPYGPAMKEYTKLFITTDSNNPNLSENQIRDKLRTTVEAQEALKEVLTIIEEARNGTPRAFSHSFNEYVRMAQEDSSYFNDFINPNRAADDKDLPPIQKTDAGNSDFNTLIYSNEVAKDSVIRHRIITPLGFAAGDFIDSGNVWIKPTTLMGTQGNRPKAEGYKFKSNGITIGGELGENSLLGVAFSYFVSDTKGKLYPTNKNDLITYIGSAYGRIEINSEFFIGFQTSMGKGNIKKKRSSGGRDNKIIKAKTTSKTLAGRLEVGYNFKLNDKVQIIPTAGFSHKNIDTKKYKEEGLGLTRQVGNMTIDRGSIVAGVSAIYAKSINNNLMLAPELHVSIDHAVNAKNSNTVIVLVEGLPPIDMFSEKLTKTYYNVGAAINTIYVDKYELSLGYDFIAGKKLQSHQGNLKLKVNF